MIIIESILRIRGEVETATALVFGSERKVLAA